MVSCGSMSAPDTLQVCHWQAMPFLHSAFVWQICAEPWVDDDPVATGVHCSFVDETSWHCEPALEVLSFATPQQISFPGQSVFWTHLNAASPLGHVWVFGMHDPCAVCVTQQMFLVRSHPAVPHRGRPAVSKETSLLTRPVLASTCDPLLDPELLPDPDPLELLLLEPPPLELLEPLEPLLPLELDGSEASSPAGRPELLELHARKESANAAPARGPATNRARQEPVERSVMEPPAKSTAKVPTLARFRFRLSDTLYPLKRAGERDERPNRVHPDGRIAMTLQKSALVGFAVFLAGATDLIHCDPLDEGPPPATPGNTREPPGPPPDSGPPQGPTSPPPGMTGGSLAPAPPAAAASASSTEYASGEYAVGADTDSYDDNDPAALSDFRGALEPYGTWTDDPTYGTVWTPSSAAVGPDFTPYVSSGHWAYDSDWVWASDYAWGWAPFHYGRWVSIEGRGWGWVPGRQYRGAWVSWSVDDGYGYLGWAPMGPEYLWFGGVAVGWHGYYGAPYVFCPRGAIFSPAVGGHVVVGPAAVAIAGRMRTYVSSSGGARGGAGPAPTRFGYSPAQIPHPTGPAAASVERAQQFSRPSTAQALGASAPAQPPRAAVTSPSAGAPHPSAPVGARPATTDAARAPAAGRPPSSAPRPAPMPHLPGTGEGGGGHHR